MTLTNITRLRKRIEVIDHEIFYKIVALSNTIKCLEKKTDASISRIQLDISDLEGKVDIKPKHPLFKE